mgnify:CR=1 FL=1
MEMKVIKELVMAIIIIGIPIAIVIYLLFYNDKLSDKEKVIFDLKLKGLDNKEIADLIDKDKKYVENTIFRIKKKYKELEIER